MVNQDGLCSLSLVNRRELISHHRDAILKIAARYGAANIRLFGSAARGEDLPASDIDFLVTMEPGRSLLDLAGLVNELEDLLGANVDVISDSRWMKPRFRDTISRDLVPV